jgi:aminomethyltransferase
MAISLLVEIEDFDSGERDLTREVPEQDLCCARWRHSKQPVEAALEWAIPKVRRTGGARAGGFPGAKTILLHLVSGTTRRRVGLRPEDRALVRADAPLFAVEHDTAVVGIVTSGGFGVSLGAPIAMGYVPTAQAIPGTRLFAEVRGKRLPMMVSELPFVPHRYKRH